MRLSQPGSSPLSRLRSARIAFGEVNEVAGLAKHPALRRAPVCTPSGEVELPAPPASVAEREVALGAVPALGQHSRSAGTWGGACKSFGDSTGVLRFLQYASSWYFGRGLYDVSTVSGLGFLCGCRRQ